MRTTKKYPNKYWFKKHVHYNQYTGAITRIQTATHGRASLGDIGSGKCKIKLAGEWYACNILAWIYMTGRQPVERITHLDGDEDNYVFANLAEEEHKRRGEAVVGTRRSSTEGRWHGYYQYRDGGKGKYVHVGAFDSEQEASDAVEEVLAALGYGDE